MDNTKCENTEKDEEPEIVVTYEELIEDVKRLVLEDTRHVRDTILENDNLVKYPKPSLTSADRTERIVARRLRTKNALEYRLYEEEKKEKKDLGFDDTTDEDEKYDDLNVVEHQIEESTVRLLHLTEDGKELISNVKIAAIAYEDKRRSVDRERRRKRRNLLEEKANKAKHDFMVISNKWTEIKQLADPLDIHNATEDQKENCLKVLAKKDDIISDLKEDLEKAEIHYIRDLAQQEEDLNILIDRINQQINIMRTAIRTELQLLEDAITDEREEIMRVHKIEWEELVQKKRDLDEEIHKKRMDLYRKHKIEIDFLDSDLRRILSEKRSENMVVLQKEQLNLQKSRALGLFNYDKFKFNSKLLQKRRKENIIVKANCRRLVMKLQYYVFQLKRRIIESQKLIKKDFEKTQKDLNNLYKGIQNIEYKGASRARANCMTYFNLWKTNECEAKKLHAYIAEKRNVLCEEFFNISPPCEKSWPKIRDLASYRVAAERKMEEKKLKVEPWDLIGKLSSWATERRALQSVLKHVAAYAEFLVEEHVQRTAKELLSDPKDRIVTNLDNLLMVIGVEKPQQIRCMLKHFITIMQCVTCENNVMYTALHEIESNREESDLDEEKIAENPLKVLKDSLKGHIALTERVVSQSYQMATCSCKKDIAPTINYADPFLDTSTLPYKFKPCLVGDTSSVIQAGHVEKIDNCLQQCHEISMERTMLLKALVNLSKEVHKKNILGVQKAARGASSIRGRWWTLAGALDQQDVNSFWKAVDMAPTTVSVWNFYVDLLYKFQMILSDRNHLNEEIMAIKKVNEDLAKILQCSILTSLDKGISYNELPNIYKYLPEIENMFNE